jgi:hypothetical protein
MLGAEREREVQGEAHGEEGEDRDPQPHEVQQDRVRLPQIAEDLNGITNHLGQLGHGTSALVKSDFYSDRRKDVIQQTYTYQSISLYSFSSFLSMLSCYKTAKISAFKN